MQIISISAQTRNFVLPQWRKAFSWNYEKLSLFYTFLSYIFLIASSNAPLRSLETLHRLSKIAKFELRVLIDRASSTLTQDWPTSG